MAKSKRSVPKKYFVAQFCRNEKRVYKTEEEYEELLSIIRRSNNRKTGDLLFGNVKKEYDEEGNIHATIAVYVKMSDRNTIENIDSETMQMESMDEFLSKYGNKRRNYQFLPEIIYFYPNVYIDEKGLEYKYDIGICKEELFFASDSIYMLDQYAEVVFGNEAKKVNHLFFRDLSLSFLSYPEASEECVNLRRMVDKIRYEGHLPFEYSLAAKDVYYSVTRKKKNGEFVLDDRNRRIIEYKNKRNFASYIKKCQEKGFVDKVEFNLGMKPELK